MLHFISAPPGLSPSDPRWVGAWWIGFLVISASLLIPSLLLCCFPSSESSNECVNRAGSELGDHETSAKLVNKRGNQQSSVPTHGLREITKRASSFEKFTRSAEYAFRFPPCNTWNPEVSSLHGRSAKPSGPCNRLPRLFQLPSKVPLQPLRNASLSNQLCSRYMAHKGTGWGLGRLFFQAL